METFFAKYGSQNGEIKPRNVSQAETDYSTFLATHHDTIIQMAMEKYMKLPTYERTTPPNTLEVALQRLNLHPAPTAEYSGMDWQFVIALAKARDKII